MHTKKVFLYFVSVGILFGCSDSKRRLNQSEINQSSPVVEYEVVEDKAQLAAIYELPHMKEWYQKRVLPPKFDFEIDLNNKSYIELLLLQNEVYARNGYLFMDAALRGHFNQFKWYQPVFDVPDFKVQLSRQESDFVNKVLRLKKEKFRNQFIDAGGYKLINPEFVFNRIQFDTVRPELMQKFNKLNFAIVPAAREQLFYVYDENQYQYIPNFYTT
ncbi:MAG: YARHG domain-containing protein, partial [Bacteroidota bacterium]